MGGMSMKLSGKYRHTDILAAWQQVAICQERQSDLGRTRQDRKWRYAGWSRLRYDTCISSFTAISLWSSVKSLCNYYTMEWGLPLFCMIESGLPLRIFFCKGSVGITKRQTGNGKSSSNKLSVFTIPSFALLPANTLEKQKYPLGKPESLKQKGK